MCRVYVPPTMKLLAALAVTAALAGCGSAASSPESDVRDAAREGTRALLSDHPERACQYMTDRDKCVGTMVLVKDMDIGAITGTPEDWEDRLERASVKVDGDTATVSNFSGDGTPGRYVRRNGKWLADNS